MATATGALDLMLVPDIAAEASAPGWAVRKVLDEMGIARRVGRVRVIDRDDLRLVVEELARRGYLAGSAGNTPGASVFSEVADRQTRNATRAQSGGVSGDSLGVALLKGDLGTDLSGRHSTRHDRTPE